MAGQAAGFSLRYAADSQGNGRVAWYYDSVSDTNYAMLLSQRSSDNYAFSQATLLTNGGFLLGNYAYFADGLDEGELRAFIFRPDIGLTDLGSLVNGGLTASGWSTLENPVYAQALDAIIGYGSVNGPAFGQSVFLMTPTSVPAPGAVLALGLAGLISGRRRRCRCAAGHCARCIAMAAAEGRRQRARTSGRVNSTSAWGTPRSACFGSTWLRVRQGGAHCPRRGQGSSRVHVLEERGCVVMCACVLLLVWVQV